MKHSQGYLYAEHCHPSNLLGSKIANIYSTSRHSERPRPSPSPYHGMMTRTAQQRVNDPIHLTTSLRSPTSHNHLSILHTISIPLRYHAVALNKKLLKGLYTSSPSSRRCLQPKSRLFRISLTGEFTLVQVSRTELTINSIHKLRAFI